MPADKRSRFLEMKYLPADRCFEVRIRDDVLVLVAEFPTEEEIVRLWNTVTGATLEYLRQPPSRPQANFFLIAPEESVHPKDGRKFLEVLESHTTFFSTQCTAKDLLVAQATLSRSPLYLVAYDLPGGRCEEYVTAERAAGILDPEFTNRQLLDSVLELKGSSLRHRKITPDERLMINRMIADML